MGGGRCTYRNCTVKYGVKTHMFHYPVFDKVRCHQWLQNAHRMNFLNLKVSQLRNRVVCQHHFKPDNFMNYKMDKLTFDAVPTEDGPYCDPTKPDYNNLQNDVIRYPITIEDIENECYMNVNDKKANMSTKYADFLTNSDLIDSNTHMLTLDKTYYTLEDKPNKGITSDGDKSDKTCTTNNIGLNNKIQPMLRVEPYSVCDNMVINYDNVMHTKSQIKEENKQGQGNNIKIIAQKKISEPLKITGNFETVSPSLILRPKQKNPIQNNTKSDKQLKIELTILPVEFSSNQISYNNNQIDPGLLIDNNITESLEGNKYVETPSSSDLCDKKINITSEQYQAEKISTENVINENKMDIAIEKHNGNSPILNNDFNKEKPIPIPTAKSFPKKTQITRVTPIKSYINNVDNTSKELSPNLPLLKSKIPPERVAAIKEKRKFNMRLRDIIEAEFNLLEENEKQTEATSEVNNLNKRIQKTFPTEENTQQNVYQFNSQSTELANESDCTFASLVAKIQSMENNLLNKIEQNSKSIVELKNTINVTNKRFSVSTQTIMNEKLQKKNLYKEISQYLSPHANSLIYEELFLNKYTQNTLTTSEGPKRRRYR